MNGFKNNRKSPLFVFINRQRLVDLFVPGQSVATDLVHEGIGIELFDVEDALAGPFAGEDHLGAEHGGNARGVGNGFVRRLP